MIITVDTSSVSMLELAKAAYPETVKNIDLYEVVEVRNWHASEALYITKGHDATVGDGMFLPAGMGQEFTREEFELLKAVSPGTNDQIDVVVINHYIPNN